MSNTENQTTVRISGKKGKIKITPAPGSTAAQAIIEAANELGLANFNLAGSTILVDGQVADADTVVDDAAKIDVTPNARLGNAAGVQYVAPTIVGQVDAPLEVAFS